MCYLYERDLIRPGKHGDEEEYEFVNARFTWEISSSSDGTHWKSIAPKQDGTKGFKKGGKVLFENIDVHAWEKSLTIPVWEGDEPLYWLRCVIEESRFEYPPRIDTIRLNTVQAINGRTIKDDVETRESDGLPHQAFNLAYAPVFNGTLGITVNGDSWKEVDDLDGSGPEDNHFVLNREKGEIRFGDGLMGKVPPAGFKIKVIQYRIGRGEDGNVKAACQWKIKGYNDLIIQNFRDAAGGAGAETIEEARVRFLKDLKIPYTAVTSGDFEYIAKNTPGLRVAKAKAVPTYHPEKGAKENSVTVVVIPFTPIESLKTPPEPSEGFKKAVCLHLDKHRLLGTEIHVISPRYVRVNVNAVIVPLNGYPEEPLRSTIISQLNRFLHPVRGWSDGKGWPIGRSVFRSEVYEVIEKIEGVDCVTRLSLSGDKGSTVDAEGNLILPSKIATIYPISHIVSVVREVERCRKEREGNGRD
jgi:predicted phage baseplate assembly protein